MKWRMADVIDHYTPWSMIAGRKAVSLEEYDLLAPLGRTETMPETLVIESAVAFGRWLVMASSEFTDSAVLDSVEEWRVHRTAGRGDVLHVTVTASADVPHLATAVPLQNRDLKSLPHLGMRESLSGAQLLPVCAHVADAGGEAVADGRLTLVRVPLAELMDPEAVRLMWAELNRK